MKESPPRPDGFLSSTSPVGATTFLSKITRAPSRKQKAAGAGSDESIDFVLSARTSATPPRVRPPLRSSRAPTAPIVPVAPNALRADLAARAHSHEDSRAPTNMFMYLPPTAPSGQPPPQLSKYKDGARNAGLGRDNMDVASALALGGVNGVPLSLTASAAALYSHVQEMANKRIATLDYLRRVHEGRTFWFNTVQFSEADIGRLPAYTPARLARRAVNFLLLGMSIPIILEIHPLPHPKSPASTSIAVAQDYLRNLNTLLAEFESFQQLHPPDGSTASSLSRARIPQMFRRAATTSRPRKSSGPVTDIGFPMLAHPSSPPSVPEGGAPGGQASTDTAATANSSTAGPPLTFPSPAAPLPSATSFPSTPSFPPPAPFDAPNSTVAPNEGPYTYLQTPPLPFNPDFFTVFATLCDVLIDTYRRLLQILRAPAACSPTIGELFSKVDSRIRKVMVSVVVREFEAASRDNARRELMNVQKVVLGGLMA